MTEYNGIMIFAETVDGKLSSMTAELLCAARNLAEDSGQPVSAVLAGSGVKDLARETIALGADRVLVADEPALKDYQDEAYLAVMEQAVKQAVPRVVLLGQTAIGRDLAPRLAFRLGTAAVMDCLALSLDPGSKRLLATKPVYGGNAQAVYGFETDPQVATVRAKVMARRAPDPERKGEVVNLPAVTDVNPRSRLLEKVKQEVAGIKLEDAAVVVSGGRGIGGPEGFQQLAELAKLLKGAVGASRPVCDNGWLPETSQVGLTGKIVTPEFYMAIAISGSSQHMAGCSGAKVIVAVNKDSGANIFKEARYGVVGDWKKVLPAFTQKVKELLAQ